MVCASLSEERIDQAGLGLYKSDSLDLISYTALIQQRAEIALS